MLGVDDIIISCMPRDFADINIIQLSKNGRNVLSVRFNKTTSESQISWQDEGTKERQGIIATGSVVSPSYLNISIAASSTLCTDGASYRCITGTSGGAISSNYIFNIKTLSMCFLFNNITVTVTCSFYNVCVHFSVMYKVQRRKKYLVADNTNQA